MILSLIPKKISLTSKSREYWSKPYYKVDAIANGLDTLSQESRLDAYLK